MVAPCRLPACLPAQQSLAGQQLGRPLRLPSHALPAPPGQGTVPRAAASGDSRCGARCATLCHARHARLPALPSQVKGVRPYAVHLTWTYNGMPGKLARMRDMGLLADPPEYYARGDFVTVELTLPAKDEVGARLARFARLRRPPRPPAAGQAARPSMQAALLRHG